jgi:hypothetical protein
MLNLKLAGEVGPDQTFLPNQPPSRHAAFPPPLGIWAKNTRRITHASRGAAGLKPATFLGPR